MYILRDNCPFLGLSAVLVPKEMLWDFASLTLVNQSSWESGWGSETFFFIDSLCNTTDALLDDNPDKLWLYILVEFFNDEIPLDVVPCIFVRKVVESFSTFIIGLNGDWWCILNGCSSCRRLLLLPSLSGRFSFKTEEGSDSCLSIPPGPASSSKTLFSFSLS